MSGPASLLVAFLIARAALAVARNLPAKRSLLVVCAVALGVLAAGWAWVYQGDLLNTPRL